MDNLRGSRILEPWPPSRRDTPRASATHKIGVHSRCSQVSNSAPGRQRSVHQSQPVLLVSALGRLDSIRPPAGSGEDEEDESGPLSSEEASGALPEETSMESRSIPDERGPNDLDPNELGDEHEAGLQESQAPLSTQVDFPCESCGAQTTWDPDSDALACDYCGHRKQVPREEGMIEEYALEDAGQTARGLGLELRVTRCDNCGAQVTFDEVSTARSCVFCGSSSVLDQEANRNSIRPESLIPLDVGRERVDQNFRTWMRGLWFRPNALKKTKKFRAVGVYLPYWTFDCQVHSDWSADAGHYYWVTQSYWTTVNGRRVRRTRRVRKVRWVPAWGSRDDAYDDLLVNASKGVPAGLAEKLGDFDTSALVPYRSEYLAGWRAEEYQLDLEGGWQVGREMVVEGQRRRCSGDVPGDTQRNLRVKNHIQGVRWKHVLLPIWTLNYSFRRKNYTVLIHGQSGRVEGQAPLSWVKILLTVTLVAMLVAAVALGFSL